MKEYGEPKSGVQNEGQQYRQRMNKNEDESGKTERAGYGLVAEAADDGLGLSFCTADALGGRYLCT